MYSSFQLIKKYLQYQLSASNGRGHGVHSPFVYDFIENVLRDRQPFACYDSIEKIRTKLLSDTRVITVEDFGAGSAVIKTNQRKVKDIAASSLKSTKFARLLFRIVKRYQPATILELGTSFGITTAYMASGNPAAKTITCEGASSIAAIARESFEALQLNNIELMEGDFADTLPLAIGKLGITGLAFIDGNHRKVPTLEYFEQLLQHMDPSGMLIFDDIHWSREMEEAWLEIKRHPSVTLTIDLFFIGLVWVNPDFKIPQHFSIRF